MKKKMRVVFVILHYNVLSETESCVKSIRDKVKKDYKIIIVDNYSPNKSGEKLLDMYSMSSDVKVILNKKNFGFSKGNNIGCKYAIENFNPDYLYVVNNDTEIVNDDLLEKLDFYYERYNFDVVGPKIWNTAKNINQNPVIQPMSLEDAEKKLKGLNLQRNLSKFNLMFAYAIKNRVKNFTKKDKEKRECINNPITDKKIGFHGAALIFSRQYCEKYNEVFLEKSFLYGEEAFLNYRRVTNNLIFCYADDIIINHNESISTKQSTASKNKKWNFQVEHMQKAARELVNLYKN